MKISIKDNNKLPAIIKTIDELDGSAMHIGVLGEGKQQMIAWVQEYGINITITPKMRRFLAWKGLHLSPKTVFIHIPERSYIRAGWDANEQEVMDKSDELIPQLINKGISVSTFLDALGQESKDRIRDFARDLRNPKLHPFTIEQKGSDNPLVDKGSLIGAITYEIL
jgi:hypothetical protein